MSAGQAVDLLLKSIVLARGGEVFITKMPVLRVEDLASVMIALLGPLRRRPINVVETAPDRVRSSGRNCQLKRKAAGCWRATTIWWFCPPSYRARYWAATSIPQWRCAPAREYIIPSANLQ
jgi:Polysaccharide biosynthesis protein